MADFSASFARYFNATEYMESKAAQLNSLAVDGRTDWTASDVATAFQQAGLTPEQHYKTYGCHETDANDYLINPSNAFDANAYAVALLAALNQQNAAVWSGKTAMDVVNTITEAGLSLLDHYIEYGAALASATGVEMAQTVPVTQRVANDLARTINVPSNYNKPTAAPSSVTYGGASATVIHKPCDMGSMNRLINYDLGLIATPGTAVATPYDEDYVPVPGGGIEDTEANPVVLVRQTISDGNGTMVASIAEYGVMQTYEENGSYVIAVRPVDADGNVNYTATPIQTVRASGTSTVLHTPDGGVIVQNVASDGAIHYTDTNGNAVIDPSGGNSDPVPVPVPDPSSWPTPAPQPDPEPQPDPDPDPQPDPDPTPPTPPTPTVASVTFNESEKRHSGTIAIDSTPERIVVLCNDGTQSTIFADGALTDAAISGLQGAAGTMTFTNYADGNLSYTYTLSSSVNVPNHQTYADTFTFNGEVADIPVSIKAFTVGIKDAIPSFYGDTSAALSLVGNATVGLGSVNFGADAGNAGVSGVSVLPENNLTAADAKGTTTYSPASGITFTPAGAWEDEMTYKVLVTARDGDGTTASHIYTLKATGGIFAVYDGVLTLNDASSASSYTTNSWIVTFTGNGTGYVGTSGSYGQSFSDVYSIIPPQFDNTPALTASSLAIQAKGDSALRNKDGDALSVELAQDTTIGLGGSRDLVSLNRPTGASIRADITAAAGKCGTEGNWDVLTGLEVQDTLKVAGVDFAALGVPSPEASGASGALDVTQNRLDPTSGDKIALVRGSYDGEDFTIPSSWSGDDLLLEWCEGNNIHGILFEDAANNISCVKLSGTEDTLILA